MTKELFWQDAYQKTAIATVIAVNDDQLVVLDQSIFYQQGGGQPSDTGVLRRNGEEFKVLFAKKMGKDISLEVDKPGLQTGDRDECEIDWPKRFAFMRMHTSAHILAKVIFDATGSLITGNQLGENESRMDFNVAEFNKEIAENFIQKANQIVQQNLEVKAEFLEYEKAMQRPELFRLKDVLPKNIPLLRIVSIGNFDVQADGGTHVRNTPEIGMLKLLKIENKGKENRRMYWTLEKG